jgi:uncharacterized membrane protein (GlpM family)
VALLIVKLVLTPALVVATAWIGRRFGPAVSGWVVALPLMSGPITCFFAYEHGRPFAARASVGSLSGTLGETAFCLGWAVAARRGSWQACLAAASAGFVAVGLAVELLPLDQTLPFPLLPLAAAGIASLALGLWLLPSPRAAATAPPPLPRWDLPVRAVVATAILLLLTGVAETLGARLSGLVAVYPMYTAVLAGFAQRHEGGEAALRIMRGLLLGLFAFAAFYLALAALLPRTSIPLAFAGATGVTLAVQAAALLQIHRERRRSVPAAAYGPVGA